MTNREFRQLVIEELTALKSALNEQTKSLHLVNLQLDILGKVTRDLRRELKGEKYDDPLELFDGMHDPAENETDSPERNGWFPDRFS